GTGIVDRSGIGFGLPWSDSGLDRFRLIRSGRRAPVSAPAIVAPPAACPLVILRMRILPTDDREPFSGRAVSSRYTEKALTPLLRQKLLHPFDNVAGLAHGFLGDNFEIFSEIRVHFELAGFDVGQESRIGHG